MSVEWIRANGEDTPRCKPSSPSTGVKSDDLAAASKEQNYATGQIILQAESEQGPIHPVLPNDRQRTAQACDKCRERKTKCSGDHPVCRRCTSRGLICQYSSRESRTRGPAKARLRNAVSSVDLRSAMTQNGGAVKQLVQPKPQNIPRAQTQPNNLQALCKSNQVVVPHRRVASLPRSHLYSHAQWNSGHLTGSTTFANPNITLFNYNHETPFLNHTMPGQSAQLSNGTNVPPAHKEIRRVQSHSTLLTQGREQDLGLCSPIPLSNNLGLFASYNSAPSRVSPMLSATQESGNIQAYDFQQFHHGVLHPWKNLYDGNNSGSERPSSGDSVPAYSPSLSEDIPESKSRSAPRIDHMLSGGAFGSSRSNPPHPYSHSQMPDPLGGYVYPAHSFYPKTINYEDLPPATVGLNHHFDGVKISSDVDVHAGRDLVFPSPITPIGIGELQNELTREPSLEGHFTHQIHCEDTGIHGGITKVEPF